MEKPKLLLLLSTFFVLVPKMSTQEIESQFRPLEPLPLCSSQLALANYACAKLPPTLPVPLPPPPPPADEEEEHGHKHRHQHRRGHGHKHKEEIKKHEFKRHELTAVEENCCRWAREVDNECVCELLAHMPNFLAKPAHEYTIYVGDTCELHFSCGGRIKI